MKKKKYIFVGNRSSVLSEMRSQLLHIEKIIAVKNSYLQKELEAENIKFKSFKNKKELCEIIDSSKFDILVSNGCPVILPVSSLAKKHQTFINVHPSFLPDLKGINPINGAILFNRSAGATCHIMEDKVDSGAIISRIEIPLTPDIDLGLLYKLSFAGEREVFRKALKRNFIPDKNIFHKLSKNKKPVYYSRSEKDLIINFGEGGKSMVRRVRAFGIESQQAYFEFKGNVFKVMDAEIITNPHMLAKLQEYKELEIAFIYEKTIIFRKGREFIKFRNITGNINKLKQGDILI